MSRSFSLSAIAVWTALSGIHPVEMQRRFGTGAPRRAAAVFAAAIAILLGVSELAQIVPALVAGRVPELIARSQGAGNFVYVLDLGVVAPLAVLAAVWLWRASPWGDVLRAIILIEATTMGFALLAMTWFAVRAGQPLERGLTIAYAVMALGSLVMSIRFLRSRARSPIAPSARLDAWLPDAPFSRHHRRRVAGTGTAPDAGARGGDSPGDAARAACSAGSATCPLSSARRRPHAGPTSSWIGRSSPASPRRKGQLFLGRAPDEIPAGDGR